jgi:hypothetical protein
MKRVAVLVGIGILLLGATAGAETVVSTHAVLGEFAQIVVGNEIEIVTIIPPGFCPSHYDLSPRDVAAVLDASMILYSGFEPWIETLSGAVAGGAALVQLPGPWATPEAAIERVETIRDLLGERFPTLVDGFAANADAYIEELRSLGDALQDRAESVGVSGIPVVCMEWQADFVSWLGFDVSVTYGLTEGLSLQDLVILAAAGRDAGAQLVIDNLQSGVDFGAKLAREIGAIHVVLSNFPGAMPYTATVIDLLRRNAESLFSAIEPLE